MKKINLSAHFNFPQDLTHVPTDLLLKGLTDLANRGTFPGTNTRAPNFLGEAGFFFLALKKAPKGSYSKKSLKLKEQIVHLRDKNLTINDDLHTALLLRRFGLFKFKGYILHKKTPSGYVGTTFEDIERIVELDSRLRSHIMRGMEIFELGVRQIISQYMADSYGPRWYAQESLFRNNGSSQGRFVHSEFLERVILEFKSIPERYISRFIDRYWDYEYPPIWMVGETITLGGWSRIFGALKNQADKDEIAKVLNVKAKILGGTLHGLTIVRNSCAHHARLYGKKFHNFGVPGDRREKGILAQTSFLASDNDRQTLAPRLYALHYFIQQLYPGHDWTEKLKYMLSDLSDDDLESLGFRKGWAEQSQWDNANFSDVAENYAYITEVIDRLMEKNNRTDEGISVGHDEGVPWPKFLLDEIADRKTGHTPDKSRETYWNGGIKWVSLADSSKLDNLYIERTDKEISPLGLENSSAVLLPKGTVVLSRDAGVGKSAIIAEDMAVSQHFVTWTVKDEFLSNVFLYYWLQRKKPEFEAIATGSTIKTIGLPYCNCSAREIEFG